MRDMKHRNLILEKKIEKNWEEMRLLVKLFEVSWEGSDCQPTDDLRGEYLRVKKLLEEEDKRRNIE